MIKSFVAIIRTWELPCCIKWATQGSVSKNASYSTKCLMEGTKAVLHRECRHPQMSNTAISDLNKALQPGQIRSEQYPFPGYLPQHSAGGQEHRPQIPSQEAV